MRRLLALLAIVLAALIAGPLIAQENAEEQKSAFLRFVEDRLSTPDRRIAINGLEGALSSDVAIAEITLSDEQGVWLRIVNAKLNWNQAALLTGRLQINTLSADRIDYIRKAIPSGGMRPPSPEATGLEIPELPVALVLENLSVPSVTFGESVFGLGSEISVDGRLVLEGGSLDTNLSIVRQDGPGGMLDVAVKYAKDSNDIDLDLALTEPRDGVVANLLNIEGRPELSLKLVGSGPIDSLVADLTLDADGKRALTGQAQLARVSDGVAVKADMHGPIAELMPAAYGMFFGTETKLSADALVPDSGGFALSDLRIEGGELILTANADTTPDGFLSRLKLDARIAGVQGEPVLLPVAGQSTSVATARLAIDYGSGETWTGVLVVNNLQTGGIAADSIVLDLSGAALNILVPDARRITFNADGAVAGISARDPQVADALGTDLGLGLAGLWNAGAALKIVEARVAGKAFDMALSGDIDDFVFDGGISLVTPSIAPFSGLAGRQLTGAMDITAVGTIALLTGGFDLTLDGNAVDLGFGIEAADKILAGQTKLSGRLGRSETGVTAEQFEIANAQSRITADGTFSSSAADFDFGLMLNDLGLLSDTATGALTVQGSAKGQDGPIALKMTAQVPNGSLGERRLAEGRLGFDGSLDGGDLTGTLAGSAFLDGHRVELSSAIAAADGINKLTDLSFVAGGTNLTGNLAQDRDGLLTGKLDLRSSDISMAAALMLTEAGGAADAAISLAPEDGMQTARIDASVRDLVVPQVRIGSANVQADVSDLFGVPFIDGTVNGTDISAGGVDIATLAGKASHTGNTTTFTLTSALANGADAVLAGALSPVGDGYSVRLSRAELVQGDLAARLTQPTALTVSGETVSLQEAEFDVGGGRVNATGTAGAALDLGVTIANLPLSIANVVRPDLGFGGTLDGTLKISGKPADPEIAFDVTGSNIDAAMVSPFGVTPLQVAANGAYAREVLRLSRLEASGPQGLAISASGTMPRVGSNGDLAVKGTIPLVLANRSVGARGTQVSGTANVDARVSGSLAKPQFSGSVTTANAEVVDPQSNLRLQQISGSFRLAGEQLIIDRFTGALATGGSISASGSVTLSPAANFPADIRINLNSARYADGNIFVATGSGQLAVTGALLRDPLLSGDLQLERAEISIPDMGGANNQLVDVTHVRLPGDVAQTLDRMRVDSARDADGQRPSVLQLDVFLTAPNKVFVRGRGVDAELGGSVRLTGSVNNIQPVGGFELIRGRLTILGQRIVFTSGRVTLVGDLNPYIDLAARSEADSTTVFVSVTGPVSDLEIGFSSQPELPQDEVLSLLIFKRALSDLSPLQLAKLAAAAAELAGGGSNSLVDSLRAATGLDDLDVITDAEGNTAVKAGRYIQDNVYVSVQAGAQGQSKISLDLDLTDTLKARGSATNDGETSVGIFYEQDY